MTYFACLTVRHETIKFQSQRHKQHFPIHQDPGATTGAKCAAYHARCVCFYVVCSSVVHEWRLHIMHISLSFLVPNCCIIVIVLLRFVFSHRFSLALAGIYMTRMKFKGGKTALTVAGRSRKAPASTSSVPK
jgi:hypothetical protein